VPIHEHVKTQAGGSDPLKLREGSVRAEIDVRCYRLSAVQKVAYKLAKRCTVILGGLDGSSLPLTFSFPPTTHEPEALDVIRLLFQDLLDQELREQIAEETRPIRALLLAHAFSKTDLIRRE
jgi:His-Xaa-Ser system protein HxsD